MKDLQQFEFWLAKLQKTINKKWSFSSQGSIFRKVYNRKLEEAYLKQDQAKKKKKIRWDKIDIESAPYKEIHERFSKINSKIYDHFFKQQEKTEERLREIAKNLNVPQTNDWIEARRVHVSSYSSQGFGAAKYAKGNCENFCQKAIFYGLKTKIEEENGGKHIDRYGIDYGLEFVAYINTNDLGLRILEFKEELDLKEWMKSCWRNGSNPRVYSPFLPYGLEEKLGIDFFGNDVINQKIICYKQ